MGLGARALLLRQRLVEIQQQRVVLLPELLACGRVRRIAALVPVGRELGQALLRLVLAHHVEKLRLQALAIALAQLVVERRALGKRLHLLQLRL